MHRDSILFIDDFKMKNRKVIYVRHPRPIGHENLCYGQTDLDILHPDGLALAQTILSLPLENFQIFSNNIFRPFWISVFGFHLSKFLAFA